MIGVTEAIMIIRAVEAVSELVSSINLTIANANKVDPDTIDLDKQLELQEAMRDLTMLRLKLDDGSMNKK